MEPIIIAPFPKEIKKFTEILDFIRNADAFGERYDKLEALVNRAISEREAIGTVSQIESLHIKAKQYEAEAQGVLVQAEDEVRNRKAQLEAEWKERKAELEQDFAARKAALDGVKAAQEERQVVLKADAADLRRREEVVSKHEQDIKSRKAHVERREQEIAAWDDKFKTVFGK